MLASDGTSWKALHGRTISKTGWREKKLQYQNYQWISLWFTSELNWCWRSHVWFTSSKRVRSLVVFVYKFHDVYQVVPQIPPDISRIICVDWIYKWYHYCSLHIWMCGPSAARIPITSQAKHWTFGKNNGNTCIWHLDSLVMAWPQA